MAEIRVTARCHPTEERSKVVAAITNVFPDFVPEGDDPVVGTACSTDRLAELLKRQRIRSAARSVLRRSMSGNVVQFTLNKQVAAAGKVSFSEEKHPLGDLDVVMTTEDIEQLVDDIAPRLEAEEAERR